MKFRSIQQIVWELWPDTKLSNYPWQIDIDSRYSWRYPLSLHPINLLLPTSPLTYLLVKHKLIDLSLKEIQRFKGHTDVVREAVEKRYHIHHASDLKLHLETKTHFIMTKFKWEQMIKPMRQNWHWFQIRCCKFSPDGHWMISSSTDKTVKLWNCDTGQCIHTFTTQTYGVRW